MDFRLNDNVRFGLQVYLIFPFLVAPDEFKPEAASHRVISDELLRLFVSLSCFRPDRFVQLLSLIPVLILLFYLLVSLDLVSTGICELVFELVQNGITCCLVCRTLLSLQLLLFGISCFAQKNNRKK